MLDLKIKIDGNEDVGWGAELLAHGFFTLAFLVFFIALVEWMSTDITIRCALLQECLLAL